MSNAAVSLATTQPVRNRPSTSGRTPCRSRAAYSVVGVMNTSENAPLRRGSTSSVMSSSGRSPIDTMSAEMRAVSDVESIAACFEATFASGASSRNHASSSSVLVRLPLCASASPVPSGRERNVGWELFHVDEPPVEYRVCPTAIPPGSDFSVDSSKTCATNPMSLNTMMRSPDDTAMPADSWPRCCRANRPK